MYSATLPAYVTQRQRRSVKNKFGSFFHEKRGSGFAFLNRFFMGTLLGAGAVFLCTTSSKAFAEPQWTAGLLVGGSLTNLQLKKPDIGAHLGLKTELLFLREREKDVALGPYVQVLTQSFDSLDAGGGVSFLVPAGQTAFVFSAGPFARMAHSKVEAGGNLNVFWGSRSYNFHSSYAYGFGVYASYQQSLSGPSSKEALLGLQIDLEIFAMAYAFTRSLILHGAP